MKYVPVFIFGLPILTFPFIANQSISWEITILILGYFIIGVAVGEHLGKEDNQV